MTTDGRAMVQSSPLPRTSASARRLESQVGVGRRLAAGARRPGLRGQLGPVHEGGRDVEHPGAGLGGQVEHAAGAVDVERAGGRLADGEVGHGGRVDDRRRPRRPAAGRCPSSSPSRGGSGRRAPWRAAVELRAVGQRDDVVPPQQRQQARARPRRSPR